MIRKITTWLVPILLMCMPAMARWDGRVFFYAEAVGLKEVDYVATGLVNVNAGVEYIGNPLKSFGCEMNLYQYIERGYSVTGIGLRPTTKYYLLRIGSARLFFEVKGGIIFMFGQYPEGGSKFNFTFAGGIGADFRLTDRTRLMVATRYAHMSNWNIYGEDNNPTWDGLGLAAGVTWQLR